MIDRRMFRDVAVAIVLAVPTLALARPQPASSAASSVQSLNEQAAFSDRTGAERRFAQPN